MNRLTNAMIRAASAGVGQTGLDVVVGGSWRALEKRHGRHDHRGLTINAMRHITLLTRKLHRMRTIWGQPFDRGDLGADGSCDRKRARADGSAIHVYGAWPALTHTPAVLC